MRKQEQEALRRLEAALLEREVPEEVSEENTDFLDDTWQELSVPQYDAYNTDNADVDLDVYSEDVRQGHRGSRALTFLMVVSLLLLVASVCILLKFLGVF